MKPLSADTFGVQYTMTRQAHDKLRQVADLLSDEIPTGDTATVVERALDLAIVVLQKRKFAATSRPHRASARPTRTPRHIPAHVIRAVSERDGGQCTFVSETGHRCPATRHLQFDHVLEVARGGEATVDNLRLLCRAHNQYAAERTFGAEFMRHKRLAAAEADRARVEAENDPERSVVPWLRALGFSLGDARRAAERSNNVPEASMEERVRAALACARPG